MTIFAFIIKLILSFVMIGFTVILVGITCAVGVLIIVAISMLCLHVFMAVVKGDSSILFKHIDFVWDLMGKFIYSDFGQNLGDVVLIVGLICFGLVIFISPIEAEKMVGIKQEHNKK